MVLRNFLKRFAPRTAIARVQDAATPAALVSAALEHHRRRQLPEARALYERALAADPANIDALHFAGVIAYQQGRHAQAEALIAQALALNTANPPAHNNLGNVLAALGRAGQAAASYRRAIALQPDYVDPYVNLGSLLVEQGLPDEAVALFGAGIAAAPGAERLHFGRAAVQLDRGRQQDAAGGFRRALALKPQYPEACNGLATALLALARPREAEESYREALRLRPDFSQAKFGCALAKLMQGDYAGGFAQFEARLERSALSEAVYDGLRERLDKLCGVPRWLGEPGAGRSLLVWTDQGFGDVFMFMRYLRLLKARGFARVVVHCEAPLVRIMQGVSGVDAAVSREAPLRFGDFDCHCPMSSLPLAFGTRLDSIPREVPYVSVPRAMEEKWAQRLAGTGVVRVGLVWAGRRDFPKDALRSIRLERFASLFEVGGAAFVSLQKGDASQRAHPGFPMRDWMDECSDLLDTAALMEQLDLVIGVDTGVVHLAAALGRPTWLLNRFESEWRWMLDRDDCAWYPTLRIFRQRQPGDWDEVLRRVAEALASFVASARQQSPRRFS